MLKEILHLRNVYWSKKDGFLLQSELEEAELYLDRYTVSSNNIKHTKIIENPLIMMDTLHSCFVHALLEGVFSTYMLKREIIEDERCLDNFNIFVRQRYIEMYPDQNLKNIDEEQSKFSGVYGEFMNIVIKGNTYFEHLLEENEVFLIKDVYVNKLKNENHRSLWNSSLYYPGRYEGEKIFSDECLQRMLDLFLVEILEHYELEKKDRPFNNNIIIVDRKTDYRSFRKTWLHNEGEFDENNSNSLLDGLDNILIEQPCLKYNGIVYLEDLTLKEQIKVFQNNDIIITPHGANMVHSLWTNNKIIVEVVYEDNTLPMYKRVLNFTNNKHAQISPYNIDKFLLLLLKRFKPMETGENVIEISEI